MVFFIGSKPPTPPSTSSLASAEATRVSNGKTAYAGSVASPSLMATLRSIVGKGQRPDEKAFSHMLPRERIDFMILTLLFGALNAACVFHLYIASGSLTSRTAERSRSPSCRRRCSSPTGIPRTRRGSWSATPLHPPDPCIDPLPLQGAALLLAGIAAAVATAPLFDRVMTHHLGLVSRVACPIIAAAWFSLIWAGTWVPLGPAAGSLTWFYSLQLPVRPNNTIALYVLFIFIGVLSVTMLPVGLELGCELTRSADASSAILWFRYPLARSPASCPTYTDLDARSANLLCIVFILGALSLSFPPNQKLTIPTTVNSALRAGPDANPPLNMRRALIFQGAFLAVACASVFPLRGKQARRERDVQARADEDSVRSP